MVLLNIEYIIGAVNRNIACPAGRDQGWETARNGVMTGSIGRIVVIEGLYLLFIHPLAHGSEVSPAARNTLDSARIPRASMLMICGLFLKGRVLAQDGVVREVVVYVYEELEGAVARDELGRGVHRAPFAGLADHGLVGA